MQRKRHGPDGTKRAALPCEKLVEGRKLTAQEEEEE